MSKATEDVAMRLALRVQAIQTASNYLVGPDVTSTVAEIFKWADRILQSAIDDTPLSFQEAVCDRAALAGMEDMTLAELEGLQPRR